MFHMLSCFDLKSGVTIDEFRESLDELTKHLKDIELIHSTGPVGRRQRHPIMDTDSERDHEFFFIMSFSDRDQCDRAVDYFLPGEAPVDSIHRAVHAKVKDPVFICWEDL